jgi:hypothetical protein
MSQFFYTGAGGINDLTLQRVRVRSPDSGETVMSGVSEDEDVEKIDGAVGHGQDVERHKNSFLFQT